MLIGKTLLKRYKIVEEIGAGGYGHTYKAIDTAIPGERYCVVKHLHPRNQDSEALKIATRLFETEAKALSRLGKNDGIPELYAYFGEDGEFYLVQEIVEGEDLSREFQPELKWSESETVSFLQELLTILSKVHEQKTVHRDIKPANIMRRDRDRKLVLIDFGAVKEILTVDKNGNTALPSVGIGTPVYMPVEQLRGLPNTYSDIYTVGLLGIQAITGLGAMDLPRDAEQFEAVLKEKQIDISPELKSFLSKAIANKPRNRYFNAQEALTALQPTVIIPEPPEPNRNPKPNPISKKLILGGLSAAALLAGVGFFALQSANKPDYAQLKTYLENKEWQKADSETSKLLLKAAKEKTTMGTESIDNLDCQSLAKIDELWTSNSDGRFGFTPQTKAYLETGNEFNDYNQSTYEAFGDRIGWRIFGVWSLYEDLKFNNIAPKGHLPSPGKDGENSRNIRIGERDNLLSKFNACGL